MYAHAHEPPPSVCEVAPALPPALDAVVQRAMAKAPGDRYLSAGDLARAAVAAAEGGVVAEPERSVAAGAAAPGGAPATVLSPPAGAPRRRRWLGAIAGLALVAAALAAILLTGGDGSSEPEPLTKDAYQDRMIDFSREISAATAAAGALPEHVTRPEAKLKAANRLADLRDIFDRTISRMRRVVPPTDVKDLHAAVIEIVGRTRGDIADAVAAAEVSNNNVYQSSLRKTGVESDKLDALAEEFRARGYKRLGIPSG
jgi:hypothetical protein